MTVPTLLQIIHVSDIHFAPDSERTAGLRASFGWAAPALLPIFGQGMMGHDHSALRAFARSVGGVVDSSNRDQTWLVLSGDLATFGSLSSIASVVKFCKEIATRLGIRGCAIYGNHDAWDEKIPWMSNQADLDRHAVELRKIFAGTWPLVPIGEGEGTSSPDFLTLPFDGSDIKFSSLNTIIHDRKANTTAVGGVYEDRSWESPRRPHQLAEYDRLIGNDSVRFVVTHHPVHHPVGGSWSTAAGASGPLSRIGPVAHVLENSMDVAKALSSGVGASACALILSGHTHQLFPSWGGLPTALPSSGATYLAPLGDRQMQLVVGTLAQMPQSASAHPHQWQLLRFVDDGGKLVLQRIVYERDHWLGPFKRLVNDAQEDREDLVVLP